VSGVSEEETACIRSRSVAHLRPGLRGEVSIYQSNRLFN
jgi:hypothetical protein